MPEQNVLLVADEGTLEIVDDGLEISERICAETGVKLDDAVIFERWLDTRYLTGKSAEGFNAVPASWSTLWR
ncbi:hypothetical protein ACFPRL_03805 [Pseudoclavibacter helvolus]